MSIIWDVCPSFFLPQDLIEMIEIIYLKEWNQDCIGKTTPHFEVFHEDREQMEKKKKLDNTQRGQGQA